MRCSSRVLYIFNLPTRQAVVVLNCKRLCKNYMDIFLPLFALAYVVVISEAKVVV